MGVEAFVSGDGYVCVRLSVTNYIYFISNVCWVPNNKNNTFSPVYLKLFFVFKRTLVEPLQYCDFIDHSIKKSSYDTTVKNNMDYLKLKLIKTTQVLVSKPKRENRCTYAPTIAIFFQRVNHVSKIMTSIYIHHNMFRASHKKLQYIWHTS